MNVEEDRAKNAENLLNRLNERVAALESFLSYRGPGSSSSPASTTAASPSSSSSSTAGNNPAMGENNVDVKRLLEENEQLKDTVRKLEYRVQILGGASSKPNELECCPPGSVGPSPSAVVAGGTGPVRGEIVAIPHKNLAGQPDEPIKVYVTGPSSKTTPIKGGIIVFHDIFGFQGGRSNHIADELAEEGYAVFCPDFFGSEYSGAPITTERDFIWPPWHMLTGTSLFLRRGRMPFELIRNKLVNTLLPFVREKAFDGVLKDKPLGSLGFCWGGWPTFRFCSGSEAIFQCGAAPHGSPHLQMLQSSGPTYEEMIRGVKVPILIMPGWNDPSTLKPGGWTIETLKETSPHSESVVYPDMIHGWAVRGPIHTDPKVKAAVEDVMARIKVFFGKYLVPAKL